MKDSRAIFDWMTMRKATIPMKMNARLLVPVAPIRVMAIPTQMTPERFAAIAFCSPCTLPPAAKKQAHATMPVGTAIARPGASRPPNLTQSAISTPMLTRSEEHTSELQSLAYLVCRLLLEKKKKLCHLNIDL